MLLIIYRSIVTDGAGAGDGRRRAGITRGVVAFLGYHELIGLSTFAVNLLVTLAIAASTDYAIFLIGRYQRPVPPARTGRRPTTRCSTAPRMSCWAPA